MEAAFVRTSVLACTRIRGALPGLLLAAVAVGAQAQPADLPPRLDRSEAAKPLPAAAAVPVPAAADDEELLPDLPPAHPTSPETRIAQRRQGNRVVEVTVIPAGSTRSYSIVNREGQRPLSVQDLSAGLSTPRFFKLDF